MCDDDLDLGNDGDDNFFRGEDYENDDEISFLHYEDEDDD
jgi:hypothetical protein